MTHGSSRARVLHWFIRGGLARTPDGTEVPIDLAAIIAGQGEGAQTTDVLTLARDGAGEGCERAPTAFAEAKRNTVASLERDGFTQLAWG